MSAGAAKRSSRSFAAGPSRPTPRKHWISNPVIQGDGDCATLTLDLLVLHLDDSDLQLGTSGVYEGTLRREAQGWRIAHRKITVDGRRSGFRRPPAKRKEAAR